MDGEHGLKSLTSDEHMDAMLMAQMDSIPTEYFPAHYHSHADHNSGFSSSMGLFSNTDRVSTNSSARRDCNQDNRAKMISQFYDPWQPSSSNSNGYPVGSNYLSNSGYGERQKASTYPEDKDSSMAAMREMIFRIAAMQPIVIDPESVKPPKRRNVKISKDPQSVAARHRRERISERIRILQRLVPGGTKMDTASMLDEAVHYMNFLKTQVQSLEKAQGKSH